MNHAMIILPGTFPATPDDELFGFPTLEDAFAGLPAGEHTVELVTFFEGHHEWTPMATKRLGRAVIEGNAGNRDEVVVDLGNGFELDGQDWFFRNLTLVSAAEQDDALIRLKNGAQIAFENCVLTTHNPRYNNQPNWPPAPPLRTFEARDSTIILHDCAWNSDGIGAKTWGDSHIELCDSTFEGHAPSDSPCVWSQGRSLFMQNAKIVYRTPFTQWAGQAVLRNCQFGEEDSYWSSPYLYGGNALFENCKLGGSPGITIDAPDSVVEIKDCSFAEPSIYHFPLDYPFRDPNNRSFSGPTRPRNDQLAICNYDSKRLSVENCTFRFGRGIHWGAEALRDIDPLSYEETSTTKRPVALYEPEEGDTHRRGDELLVSEADNQRFGREHGLLPQED